MNDNEDEGKASPEDVFIDEEVLNILRESLKMKLKDDKKRPSKVRINTALKGSIHEFLSCFKLIGFDIEGNPITMTISHNKMEKNAIDNAFMQHFGEFVQARGED
jgi:hypothetical protein